MDVRALAMVMRGGNLRARVGAVRAGQSAIRVAMTGAALDSGVLDALREPRTVDDLASRLGFADRDLLLAFVRTLEASRLVRQAGGRHEITRRGRAIADDPVARAAYTAFSDFHTGVYRDIAQQLRGGDGRRDVTDRAQVIADLSRFMQPMVEATLREEVSSRPTRSVVDLGCGSGMLLATMLQAAPDARGVGIELDPVAAQHAEENLSRQRLDGRARVLVGEAREMLAGEGPFDVALLANMVYYLPVLDRPALFRTVRDALAPGAALVVVTTALTDDWFSRHFDVLIRAQEGSMELPDLDVLRAQVEEAGFTVESTRRLTPGEPLMAVVATAS
jgi:protein-L-isoaspartate O-methyltransferase